MTLLALLLLQDPATEWIDRVSRDVLQSVGPLQNRPLTHVLQLGLYAAYDSNVNLEESDEDAQTVLAPFLRVRFDYSERQLDAAADVLVNWKYYIPDHEHSDDEERVYARVRFLHPKISLEAAEIFQHVSDPTDVVFADRVDRYVSDTHGRARYEAFGGFALEADVALGIVRFAEKAFDDGDHWSLRGGPGVAIRLSSALEAVAQAGAFLIDYRYSSPEDVDGLYVRGGLRGDLLPTLSLTALAGAAEAEAGELDDRSGEASVHLAWEASPTVTVYGDYSRMFVFGGGLDPYQIVNSWIASAAIDATPEVRLLGRIQFDHADTALGQEREYASLAGSVRWRSHEQVFFDAGLTYRRGEVAPGSFDYDEWVVHVGVLITN